MALVSEDGSNVLDIHNNHVKLNGKLVIGMVAFAGEIDGIPIPGRWYRYGANASSSGGIVMPLSGKVVYLTLSNKDSAQIGSSHLWKNGVITTAQIGVSNEQYKVEEVSEAFVAGDGLQMRFTSGIGLYPVCTFFVQFD